jgi:predicted nucleic-acid-binding Zn-ribbon protein
MSKRNTKCPKCQGEMEKGYLLGAWSWISDKKQINPREAKKIFGYGCRNCGYVEFYLREA